MYIKISNLSKSFKMFKRSAGLKGALSSFFNRKYTNFLALKQINLELEKGEIVGILGENGAGKTTLIKLMVGLLHPTEGDVVINGYNPWKRNHEYLRGVTIVMGQKNQLWWDIPASESFLLNKHIYQIDDSIYEETLNELVDLLDVRDKLDVQVRRLSLGERMKMEIIAALLHRPSLVLLDEPTLGLDVISQSKIRDFVKYYNKKYNATFIITSHYTKDIQEMCKRVLVLHDGEQIYDGEFSDLIKSINPRRRLFFEFSIIPEQSYLNNLKNKFKFELNDNILTAQLPESELKNLLSTLLDKFSPQSMSFEDLPVEEAMKSFFQNPQNYL
jgi:ABC-2 type transport system ATP-binding protein